MTPMSKVTSSTRLISHATCVPRHEHAPGLRSCSNASVTLSLTSKPRNVIASCARLGLPSILHERPVSSSMYVRLEVHFVSFSVVLAKNSLLTPRNSKSKTKDSRCLSVELLRIERQICLIAPVASCSPTARAASPIYCCSIGALALHTGVSYFFARAKMSEEARLY